MKNVNDLWTTQYESTWGIARWFFLRLLGAVGFIAFLSYFVQVDGLVGSDGIVPVAEYLEQIRASLAGGGQASAFELFTRVPTLLWLSSSDAMISGVCTAGMAASAALVFGVWPRMMLFIMWGLYLSLATASGLFMGFQWDTLLLETTLLAVFLAPSGFLENRSERVSRVGLVLMVWLLFRLMFMSGVVKLTSGDETWRDLSAMTYHYWTQPIPNWTSWWAHQLPTFFHSAATAATLVLEIAVPLLLFMPRRARRVGAVLLGVLQLAIIATGNYGFFNLLALALCLLALDDAPLERLLPVRLIAWIRGRKWTDSVSPSEKNKFESTFSKAIQSFSQRAPIAIAAAIITLTSLQMLGEFTQKQLVPEPIHKAYRPFRSLNNYGLFRVMTTERPEILVEGSNDGQNWRTYEFKYKPDHLDERPPQVAPHMPRLDWQMWFAALGECRSNRWLLQFQGKLLQGEDAVIELLADDPFGGEPPTYMRTTRWKYQFTTPEQRRETGHWWRREKVGPYCPPLMLRDGQLSAARGL
ncbi:MAG: lipase maturation factor family protein [Persicimonas sp.]